MEPYFHYPAPENMLRHRFNQHPADESPFSETPFVVNNHFNQTLELESALSRLNISSSPSSNHHRPYTGFNGGVLFGNMDNGGNGRFGSSSSRNLKRGFSQNFQYNQNGSAFAPDLMNQNGVLGHDSHVYSMVNRGFRDESTLRRDLDEICLRDLRGQIVSLALDQYGSRLLQMKFDSFNVDEIDMIFCEVIDRVPELMTDQFGNYLIQKLIEACNEEQTTEILLAVTNTEFKLVRLCLDIHGTRAVQKLLKHLTTPQQITLLMLAITHGALRLAKDANGHHVIKHCVKHFPYEDTKYLLKEIAEHCLTIATDKSGCCVLPACVEASRGELRERLLSDIVGNAFFLAEDRYGNYIIQCMLEFKRDRLTSALIRRLEGNFFTLSCNKYGSNVVEKCLTDSDEDNSRVIIMELLRNPNISILLNDPFGNYVFQSALAVSKGLVHNALVKLVELHYTSMRNNLYGKKVLSWFEKKKKKSCNTYQNWQKTIRVEGRVVVGTRN